MKNTDNKGLDRRQLLLGSTPLIAGAVVTAHPQVAEAKSPLVADLDLGQSGLDPYSKKDQTEALQKAIDKAGREGKRLRLPGGVFRTGALKIGSGVHIEGLAGRTTLKFEGGAGLLLGQDVEDVTLAHLIFDGAQRGFTAPSVEALLGFERVRRLLISHCQVKGSLLSGISLEQTSGQVIGSEISDCGVTGLFALDSNGLEISHNQVSNCGNNGILVWRSKKGYDGTIVSHNRVQRIRAKAGGTGQNGNGINIYRSASVIVSNNVIHDCTFSAVRNNGGDNVQILSNSCSKLGEVALYSEFKFEGAVINNNLVDGAHVGISITNFNEGGRLATATGNLIRNIKKRKGKPGIGIAVEADTLVSGNVIETVEGAGISIGWERYLRQVTANNNLLRDTTIGIGVSGDNEAGFALIATNMIHGSKQGGIRAMDRDKPLGPDLAKSSAEAFRNLAIYGNVSL